MSSSSAIEASSSVVEGEGEDITVDPLVNCLGNVCEVTLC